MTNTINGQRFDDLRQAVLDAQRRAVELQERSRAVVARAEEVLSSRASLHASRIATLTEEVAGLRKAMESRAVIEQAKGMIMASVRCDADKAFELLVTQSQHQNRKVRELAEELVRVKSRPVPR